jgi:hypothetical protein
MPPLSRSSRHHARTLLLCALMGCATQACTYDFDQFKGASGADMAEMGDLIVAEDMATDLPVEDLAPDIAPNLTLEDMVAPRGAIGAACAMDDECDAGLCEQGICTQECEAIGAEEADADACEGYAVCRVIAPGRERCVIGCAQDADCAAGSVCGAGACLPDGDADSVADWLDTCPEVANPTQEDSDLDGLGDACDPEPLCPQGHVDGVRALEISAAGVISGASSMASQRYVMLTGEAGVTLLDLVTGKTQAHATLPYVASEHGIIGLGAGEAWLTPGVGLGQASGQAGRWLKVNAAGVVSEGGPFTLDVQHPGGAQTRFGALMLGSTRASQEAPTTVQIERVNPEAGSTQGGPTYGVAERVPVTLLETPSGELVGYSGAFLTAPDQPWGVVMWTFGTSGQVVDGRVVLLPDAEGTTEHIDPVFMRTRSGLMLALDRRTGQAWRLVVGRPEGEWLRMAGLDITWGVDTPRVVVMRDVPGVVVLGESGGSPVASQIALACLPGAAGLDSDGDGVPDVRDTCPDLAEPEQRDLDGDGLGDACDDDDDADGVPDALDVRVVDPNTGETESLAADTDDDGQPNDVDEDDDGDGVPDVRDRWPLDPDDDGLQIWEDADNDDDGAPDAEELAAGTNPRDRLSFPGGGRLVWVRDQKVEVAALADLSSVQEVDFGAGTTPTRVRWSVSSEDVLALDGEPGVAQAVMMQEAGLTVPATRFEIGLNVRSAALVAPDPLDPAGKPGVVVVHEAEGMAGRWVISRLAWEDGSRRLILKSLAALGEIAGWSDRIYFAGTTAPCVGCERGWTMQAREDVQPAAVLPNVRAVREVRRAGGTICVVGELSEEEPTQVAWVGATSYLPPGAVKVEQCVPMAQYGHLVVRAQDSQGSYALWLFNGRIRDWVRLPGNLSGVRDLDWKQ